jgi:hypothetical protein
VDAVSQLHLAHVVTYQVASGGQFGTFVFVAAHRSLKEWDLFAINPAMSRPTAQMAAADPDFWAPKPAVASGKALAAKKVSSAEKPRP